MQVQIPVSLYTSLLQQQRLQEQVHVPQEPVALLQPTRKNATSSSFHSLPVDLSALSAASVNTMHNFATADASKSKADFVECLVGTASLIIESIWPNHSISSKAALLPLKKFIREILRRSRTSFSTLQLALLYIVRLRSQLTAKASVVTGARPHATLCGRRMLLSALIVAAKYLQDRNYSNKAWAKIAGLPLEEINLNEMEFLRIMDYDLYVSQKTYTSWSTMLLARTAQIRRENHVSIGMGMEQASPAASLAAAAASIHPFLLASNGYATDLSSISTTYASTPVPPITSFAPVVPSLGCGKDSGRIYATPSFSMAFPSVNAMATPSPAAVAGASSYFQMDTSMASSETDTAAAILAAMTPPAEDAPTTTIPTLTKSSSAMTMTSEQFSQMWGGARSIDTSVFASATSSAHAMLIMMQQRQAASGSTQNYPSPSASEVSTECPTLTFARTSSDMSTASGKREREEDDEEPFLPAFGFGMESPSSDCEAGRKRLKC